ncbi:MAG: 5-methyltetrahydropteroyltriglutamate--homocysteine S-methyltransferase, partial [Schaalia hyovaginalis]|nr:5-methyltetrahydropteroyltriglutamate--homocysteine S-methyltransferase [Schaalia hyovaginalis]
MTTFPAATILGYPRIGRGRELKKALEAHWAGRTSAEELLEAERALRRSTLARLVELGLPATGSAIPENSSLYDQVLDVTTLLGAVPRRFAGREGLALAFALARGDEASAPEEMTKWFDTNYHYLVPEIGPDTPISYADNRFVERFVEAKEWGYETRPVVVGPRTNHALAKAHEDAPGGYDPLDRLDDALAAYSELLTRLARAGAAWVQFDEPALVSDNLRRTRAELAELASGAYSRLAARAERPAILVTTPYGNGLAALPALASSGVEAIHLDLLRGVLPEPGEVDLSAVDRVIGIVDGRARWRAHHA